MVICLGSCLCCFSMKVQLLLVFFTPFSQPLHFCVLSFLYSSSRAEADTTREQHNNCIVSIICIDVVVIVCFVELSYLSPIIQKFTSVCVCECMGESVCFCRYNNGGDDVVVDADIIQFLRAYLNQLCNGVALCSALVRCIVLLCVCLCWLNKFILLEML